MSLFSTSAATLATRRPGRACRRQARHSRVIVFFVAWLALVMPVAAKAEDVAGRVISVTGDVVATRPDQTDERPLDRRDSVVVSDVIITREDSRTQIRFQDEGLIDLRPNSRLEVATYEISDDPNEPSRAVMNFTRGALRTVSGSIGSGDDDEYRLETTVGSIGIRGTDYALQYCDTTCPEDADPDGLYGRVNDGIIVLTNEVGTFELRTGEYFFALDDQSIPEIMSSVPGGILDGTDDGETGDDEDEDDEAAVNGLAEATATAAPVDTVDEDDDLADLSELGGLDDLDDDALRDLLSENEVDEPEPDEPEPDPTVERVMAGTYSYAGPFLGGLVRAETFETDETELEGGLPVVTEVTFEDGTRLIAGGDASDSIIDLGFWESDDSDAMVYWGRWRSGGIEILDPEGETLLDSSISGETGFRYIFSEDVTTFEELESAGEQDTLAHYSAYSGSEFFAPNRTDFCCGGPDDLPIREFGFSVDFENFKIVDFAMTLGYTNASNPNPDVYDIRAFQDEIDIGDLESLYELSFDLEGSWERYEYTGTSETIASGDMSGALSGQFIGVDADGIIYFLDMDLLDEDDELYDQWYGSGLMTEGLGPE